MKYKKTIAIIFMVAAVVFNLPSYSQSSYNKCDTVKIVAPAYLILNDTSIHLFKDSTAIICDKYIVLTKKMATHYIQNYVANLKNIIW